MSAIFTPGTALKSDKESGARPLLGFSCFLALGRENLYSFATGFLVEAFHASPEGKTRPNFCALSLAVEAHSVTQFLLLANGKETILLASNPRIFS